jgi:hypothetical protein
LQEVFYAAVRPLFGKYLTTADDVFMLGTVYVLSDSDTVGVVGKRDTAVILIDLTAIAFTRVIYLAFGVSPPDLLSGEGTYKGFN